MKLLVSEAGSEEEWRD